MVPIIETHPHGAFIPANVQCLILGSFPGKDQTGSFGDETKWFYSAPRNQFWKIMELAYGTELKSKKQKQQLFERYGIGITDIIRSCIRTNGTNLDENLEVKEYNIETVGEILRQHCPKVLFTSRFVEKLFRKFFAGYTNTDLLPSPSPRYFRLSPEQKAALYKQKLPMTGE
ncbi:MAG: uracil-DNA glycosylase family protein [Flavisolibacter sp.]